MLLDGWAQAQGTKNPTYSKYFNIQLFLQKLLHLAAVADVDIAGTWIVLEVL